MLSVGFLPFLPSRMLVLWVSSIYFGLGKIVPTGWKNKYLVLEETASSRDHVGFAVERHKLSADSGTCPEMLMDQAQFHQ